MVKERLSNVDTAWLRMEDPANLMMITGVIILGAPLDYERLKATLEQELLRFDRFRQRIVGPGFPGGRYRWVEDPDFDIQYHLQPIFLPPPGDQAVLRETASLLASTRLDITRPLWQLHLVANYGHGSAVICRLHHSIADGMALVHVLLSTTGPEPDPPWPVMEPQPEAQARRPRLANPLLSARQSAGRFAELLRQVDQGAGDDRSMSKGLLRTGAGAATALGRLVLRKPDPKTMFKGGLEVAKRVAWSESLPLSDVKKVGRELGGTVNDVLLTAVAGGLRRYLLGRGEPVDGLDFRAVVPVNLRRPGTEEELGNQFGMVFLSLPIGIRDPAARLDELKRRMDGLKGSLEPLVSFGVLKLIGGVPSSIQNLAVDILESKATAVMTNVIGPSQQLYLAGAPVEALLFWVPQSGRVALGISILSYAGQVWLGVLTDERLVPDPDGIVDGFHAEFDNLLGIAHRREEMVTVEEMSAMLDGALATLDALLEQKAKEEAPVRCGALTKVGKPCRNYALPGSEYCRVHQDTKS